MKRDLQSFKDMHDDRLSLGGALKSLTEELQKHSPLGKDFNTGSPDNVFEALKAMNDSDRSKQELSQAIAQTYNITNKLLSRVKEAMSGTEMSIALEFEERNRVAAWERSNAYKVWMHRTIRWSLGVVLVVLLYSSAVKLSDKWDFIKIPIRDMVIHQAPE